MTIILIIDAKAAGTDKIKTLAEELRHFDLIQTHIRPALRKLLDKVSRFLALLSSTRKDAPFLFA